MVRLRRLQTPRSAAGPAMLLLCGPAAANLPAHFRRSRSPASCSTAPAVARSAPSVPRWDWHSAPASCRSGWLGSRPSPPPAARTSSPSKLHRLSSLIQREAQVGGHLPHIVILRIVFQNLQVFRERVGRFPLLQELLRLFDAAGDFGTIRVFRHGRSGTRCLIVILGLTSRTSNAVSGVSDYEGHGRARFLLHHRRAKMLSGQEIEVAPFPGRCTSVSSPSCDF